MHQQNIAKNESSVKSKTVSPVHTVSVCMLFGLARLLVCGRYKQRFYNYSTRVHIKLLFLHILNFSCNNSFEFSQVYNFYKENILYS